jgi:thioredoxin-like negative regulator of GroEL
MSRIPDKMIGFKYKSASLCTVLLVFASLWLSACVQAPVQQQQVEAVEQAPAPAGAEPVPEAVSERATEQLTAPLLYDVLLGEIAGQRGLLDISGASYLEASQNSRDPRIAERALKILIYAKQSELALQAARRWVELAPENLEARQALAVLALRTGHDQEALSQLEYMLERGLAGNGNPYQPMLALLAREPDK